MPSPRGLPFGRPPTQPPATQFLDERRRNLPPADGWLLTGVTNQARTLSSSATITADKLYLIDLGPLDRDYLLHEARIGVITGVAASRVKAGLFTLDQSPEDAIFRLVPGSSVDFSTATTSSSATVHPFNRDIQVFAGQRYFLGSLTTGGASRPNVTVLTQSARVWPELSVTSTTSIPTSILLSSLSASYTNNIPTVVYVSQPAAIVL